MDLPRRHRVATPSAVSDPRSAAPARPLDEAVEALRGVWRAGFTDRMAIARADGTLRRLRQSLPSQQGSALLNDIGRQFQAYQSLPVAERGEALKRIAGALEALRPHLQTPTAPTPFGTLPSAVAPRRSSSRAAKPRDDGAPPAVKSVRSDAPVTALPRVGAAVAKKLEGHRAEIRTVEDLLRLAPVRHIDYSRTEPIGAALRAAPGSEVTVRGEITELREAHGGGPPRVVAKLSDGTGWMRITWFSTFVAKQISVGDELAVSGEVKGDFGPLSFTNPEWERIGADGLSTGRLTPVYPLTKGLHQKSMRSLTRAALDATRTTVEDFLPAAVRDRLGLLGLAEAYEAVHYPDTDEDRARAVRRLAFDDLFLLQLGHVQRRRERRAHDGIPFQVDPDRIARFHAGLPFRLTGAQTRALGEILTDLEQPRPMSRLLQGDVGSGKTVVAATAALAAVESGCQAAVMAPTEILAEQHFHNFRGLYAGLAEEERPTVALLTGSTRAAERRAALAAAAAGEVDVLVGTHALIQGTVEFARLGLAVVDEQHRFGVRQRADLPGKGAGAVPHALAMTATPIPRTLNLVLNGDLDVSVIGELPPGRVPIETRRYFGDEREAAYDLVREQVDLGHQVFVICPLVEESEAIEAKAAVAEAERLQQEVFPELRVALLHGRMAGRDKDAVMTAFRDRAHDVLVSTSVIEVGIDVPNATVMLIEGADRFGLSQLHQFRGRVGRGGARSYCLLLADEATPVGEERLQTMVDTTDGFVLAQKDLELRGPGDVIGTRQSGLPELAWLDGGFDTRLLDEARQAAEDLLALDPDLAEVDHLPLKARLQAFWLRASPDVPL